MPYWLSMLEIVKRDGLARLCKFETRSGVLRTPALLPVVNPKILLVTPKELHNEFGFGAIITNSYIIKNDTNLKNRAQTEGLHKMLDFPGIIMTDSGTFQSHMYGEVKATNDEMIEFQKSIGTDIGTVLDIFTEPYWTRGEVAESISETLERTQHACDIKGDMMINGVVQGSIYSDLREDCARKMATMNVDVHPIGGTVPLMEQYRYAELVDIIIASKKGLAAGRPVHLFGAGHPMLLAFATLLGCDLFDSASYAKFARDDRFMFTDGTFRLSDMQFLDCNCPACRGNTLESIKRMDKKSRENVIARHNLYQITSELALIRRCIEEERLWELAEIRCRAHPSLLDGLRRLKFYRDYLECKEPISRDRAVFYTGGESRARPTFYRYTKRLLERYVPSFQRAAVFTGNKKPYSKHYTSDFNRVRTAGYTPIIVSPFGPVPAELDEIYPIAQSLFPDIVDQETNEDVKQMMDSFFERMKFEEVVDENEIKAGNVEYDANQIRVRATARYQFGIEATNALFRGKIDLVLSRKTGKVRNVISDGEHILSMRANDGFYTLRPEGAERIIELVPYPKFRVVVVDDAVPYILQGRNAFCQFVADMDPDIRPMEEVIVVDKDDNFVATGRAILTWDEIRSFRRGVAVKIRSGGSEV
ncbi:MAG: tRNA guanosine(15) transglycosylase TgtA [archaeon]|nr:tRNA guanosine(15) transglycosylase TgtA [archaeon]